MLIVRQTVSRHLRVNIFGTVDGKVRCTHECGEDPLSERRGDLLVANRSLLAIHVKVKLLRSAGQEPL